MFLGYFLSYKQWFNNQVADAFSKLVLNLALPFNMFLNMTENFSRDEFLSLFSGMIIPLISMAVTFFISLVYRRIFLISQGRQGTFSTMFTCSNTIFIGLPINLAVFGEKRFPMSCYTISSILPSFGPSAFILWLKTTRKSNNTGFPFTR